PKWRPLRLRPKHEWARVSRDAALEPPTMDAGHRAGRRGSSRADPMAGGAAAVIPAAGEFSRHHSPGRGRVVGAAAERTARPDRSHRLRPAQPSRFLQSRLAEIHTAAISTDGLVGAEPLARTRRRASRRNLLPL